MENDKDDRFFNARFILRHMWRCAFRSLLLVVVAAAFVFALCGLQYAIADGEAKVEHLYDTTIVKGELVKKDASVVMSGSNDDAYISENAVEALKSTGYMKDIYLEATMTAMYAEFPGVSSGSPWICRNMPLYAVEDIGTFINYDERNLQITYGNGYSERIFNENRSEESPHNPIIVPERWLERYKIEYGDKVPFKLSNFSERISMTIAGTYRDNCNLADRKMDPDMVIFPLWLLKYAEEDNGVFYRTVEFTIDRTQNREIDAFKEVMKEALKSEDMGIIDLNMVVKDKELKQVIKPFEKNLTLMQTLYPVTLAASVLIGGGLTFLMILQRAREAALLRILGNSLQETRRVLVAEALLLCLFGVLLGAILQWLIFPDVGVGKVLMCVGLYLLGSILGTILGAVHITRKMPLELLQVKE